ncbi:protein of unknown function [Rhodovastum atsumiense]|nr:protein of unknown function [Rhodovastum atsumiense]
MDAPAAVPEPGHHLRRPCHDCDGTFPSRRGARHVGLHHWRPGRSSRAVLRTARALQLSCHALGGVFPASGGFHLGWGVGFADMGRPVSGRADQPPRGSRVGDGVTVHEMTRRASAPSGGNGQS